MEELLSAVLEHEEIQAPPKMENLPLMFSVTVHRFPRRQARAGIVFAIMASIGGGVVVASVVDRLWQVDHASQALSTMPTDGVWTDGWISSLDAKSFELVTTDGKTLEFGLDFAYTSVFQENGVLNITHLKPRQQVRVLPVSYNNREMAKAVEITRSAHLFAMN